jgi:mono/diheme cytochrome c family protein
MRTTALRNASLITAGLMAIMVLAFAWHRSEADTSEDISSLGAEIFNSRCSGCHPRDSVQGGFGPGLKNLAARGTLPVSDRPVNEANLLRQLNEPVGVMPSFKDMDAKSKSAVVDYLLKL